ncbi:hypothetical protein CF319_g2869 [Tilletia indica]|nr:hypothetical protein CF319_g2869 [Tilletia indica]
MPLHRIFHPTSVLQDPAEKKQLAKAITDVYSGPSSSVKLPAFYVVVVFHPLEPGVDFFVGGEGERAADFIRIAIDHIAVPLPPKDQLAEGRFDGFMDKYEAAIKPFIGDKGLHHEITIADSPRETWRINNIVPPRIKSAAHKRWHEENKATTYTEEDNRGIDTPW